LQDGSIRLYCLEKVVGKVALTIKGGDDYTFVSQSIFNGDSVQSVNGQTGAINITASDIGALTSQDVERLTIAIENTASEIANLQEQINGLTSGSVTAEDVANLQSQIDSLNDNTIAELQEQIDSLNDNMVTESTIANLQGQIDTIKGDIAEIESDIDGAVAELEGI
jgi:chromosome segregation ATPase